MTVARFHGEARLEFLDVVAYYEAAEVGLGERFRQSVEAAVALAVSLPFFWFSVQAWNAPGVSQEIPLLDCL